MRRSTVLFVLVEVLIGSAIGLLLWRRLPYVVSLPLAALIGVAVFVGVWAGQVDGKRKAKEERESAP